MRSRNLLIAAIFTVTLLFITFMSLDRWVPGVFNIKPDSPVKAARAAPVKLSSASNLPDAIVAKLLYLARIVSADKEIIVYAAMALFGILIVALAVGASAPSEKHKTDVMLELLREEKEKAENLAKLRSEFLNQVSHELRTPLAVIIGYVECLTDGLYGKVEGKHQEILEVVAKQSGHLKDMIDQILIFSRLEANRQAPRMQEFSPNKLLSDLRDTFDFLCGQKGIEMKWELSRATPMMKSDPDRFKEIASNLLQNAVKYTDTGSITVALDSLPSTDSIVLSVSDTGIGIPATSVKTIFEPFIQVHKTSSTNSRGGIGLGLSIVRKHVEQLKGSISVHSDLGQGSTFRVLLPRTYKKYDSRYKKLLRAFKFTGRREQPAIIGVEKDPHLETAVGRAGGQSRVA